MSGPLIAGGVAHGAPPAYTAAFWSVDASRRLSLHAADGSGLLDRRLRTALAMPVPGTGAPLAADADHLRLLTDRGLYRLDVRSQRWRPLGYVEDDMKADRYTAAWQIPGGGFIAVDPSRALWSINTGGAVSEFLPAVPGVAPIIAADAANMQVLHGDGTRLGFFGRGWILLGEPAASFTGAETTMRLRALGSFCLEAGRDVAPGDEFEADEARARVLIGRGKAEPVAEPA